MKTNRILAAVLGAASFASASMIAGVAQADPAYTADQIVERFIASAKLGEARAICIGTAQECAKKVDAPLEALDMRVTFEYESATLTPTAMTTLREFAKALNNPRLEIATFKVEGHTDAHGSDTFNDDLSSRRAAAVTRELVAMGVSASRIDASGYGERKPLSADPFDAQNRRVEARMVMPKD